MAIIVRTVSSSWSSPSARTIGVEPRLVSSDDVDRADIIVSIGCDRGEIPGDGLVEWDVPMLSEDFAGSMNALFERSEALARSLLT